MRSIGREGDVPDLLIKEVQSAIVSLKTPALSKESACERGVMMVVERVCCPQCQSEEVVKYGTTTNGKPRFRCQPTAGCGRTFIRAYAYQGRVPGVKQQIIEMTLNGSGVRDIAHVLQLSPMTVIGE